MVLPGSLRALVLLCLLAVGCRSAQPDPKKVDIKTLARIIQFFDDNYKKVNENNNNVRQYAVAINVPKEQCQENFAPDQSNFLRNELPSNVKNKIYEEKEALYKGKELIAAGTKKNGSYSIHSESILMNSSKSSPMTDLLNKRTNGCVVFYTYNSPCVKTCIAGRYNILEALENWSKHVCLKAFVFKNIWKHDNKPEILKNKFKEITKYVPLYRCVSSNECYECLQGDNINQRCVQ